MPIITICTSVNFYRQAVDMQARLEKMGYKVLLPKTAEAMKKSGNYDAEAHRTWLKNPADYHKKTGFIRGHFPKIEQADAILVLNYEKHGQQGYVGGNVLIEMGVAFYLGKPIYLLNDVPEQSSFREEIIGMEPKVIHHKFGEMFHDT